MTRSSVPTLRGRPDASPTPQAGIASRGRWLLAAVVVLALANAVLWIVRTDVLTPSWAAEHPTSEPDDPGIGEVVPYGGLTVTVESVEQGVAAGEVTLDAREADGELAEIRIEFRNDSAAAVDVSSTPIHLVDAAGREHSPVDTGWSDESDADGIAPGETRELVVVFDLVGGVELDHVALPQSDPDQDDLRVRVR